MQQRDDTVAYRIISDEEWAAARVSGEFVPDRYDEEGFVHLSARGQVLRPANLLYTGRTDLKLLVVKLARLQAEVLFEPGSHGEAELFPHLYGHLNVDAVIGVIDFPCEPDGSFRLPDELAAD